MKLSSLTGAVNFSKWSLQQVCNVKAYRLNKKAKFMQELARELLAGKGYILASSRELKEMYPDYFSCYEVDDEKIVWSIDYKSKFMSRMVDVYFIPVR